MSYILFLYIQTSIEREEFGFFRQHHTIQQQIYRK